MITPKLTAVMVVMTALMGATPIAAFAQATNAQVIGDLTNAAAVETGENSQINAAETTQLAVNTIKIRNEAESEADSEANAESEAEGGDAEAESGDGRSGDAAAEGGDAESAAEAESEAESTATAVQLFSGVEFDNDVSQTSATVQTNNLDDADAVTVTQTNVPVQTQTGAIAVDIDAEGLTAAELVALIEGILGDDGGVGCSPWDPRC
jgi:hypothetical protein